MKFLNCQAHFTSNPHIHQSQFAGEGIEIDNGNCISHTFSLETEERRSQLGRSSNGVVNTSKCESREVCQDADPFDNNTSVLLVKTPPGNVLSISRKKSSHYRLGQLSHGVSFL